MVPSLAPWSKMNTGANNSCAVPGLGLPLISMMRAWVLLLIAFIAFQPTLPLRPPFLSLLASSKITRSNGQSASLNCFTSSGKCSKLQVKTS